MYSKPKLFVELLNNPLIQLSIKQLYIEKPIRAAIYMIAVLTVLQYGQTVLFENYVLDDHLYVTGNKFVKRGIGCDFDSPDRLSAECIQENWRNIWGKDVLVGYFGKENTGGLAGGRYRPLSLYTFAVEYEFFEGKSPGFAHFINLLLYFSINFLLFLIVRMLFDQFKIPSILTFVVVGLFCVHPLHVEVVANIKGRMEMMAAGFGILGVYLLMKHLSSDKKQFLYLSLLAFLLGMLSKEEVITFLAIIPMVILLKEANTQNTIKTSAWFLIPFGAYFLIRNWVFGDALNVGDEVAEGSVPLLLNEPFLGASTGEQLATVFYTWWRYIELLVFPYPLTHDYYPHHIEIKSFTDPKVWLGIGVVALSIWGFFKSWKQNRIISFGILWYWATFSITSNLLFNVGTFMNERFMFLPSFGFILVMVLMGYKFLKNAQVQKLLVGVMATSFLVISFNRAQAWESNFKLFTTDVEVSENSLKSNMEVADELISRGIKSGKMQYLKQARKHLEKASTMDSAFIGPYDLMGRAFYSEKKYFEAGKAYLQAIEIGKRTKLTYAQIEKNFFLCILAILEQKEPDFALKLLNQYEILKGNQLPAKYFAYRGRLLAEFYGKLKEALPLFEQAYQLDKRDYDTQRFLFIANAQLGKIDKAKKFATQCLNMRPNDQVLLQNLLVFYRSNGMTSEEKAIMEKLNALKTNESR